jgi:hypothetical protein
MDIYTAGGWIDDRACIEVSLDDLSATESPIIHVMHASEITDHRLSVLSVHRNRSMYKWSIRET